MEMTFSELRTKEVVNTQDGRKLGKVCDIVFCYPENRWLGIVAPNGRAFRKNGVFIELRNIVKIGEDVILVNVGLPKKRACKRGEKPCANFSASGGNGGNNVGGNSVNGVNMSGVGGGFGGLGGANDLNMDSRGRSFEEYE